eukprot:153643-Pelagomonas_calceolata.AAC.2
MKDCFQTVDITSPHACVLRELDIRDNQLKGSEGEHGAALLADNLVHGCFEGVCLCPNSPKETLEVSKKWSQGRVACSSARDMPTTSRFARRDAFLNLNFLENPYIVQLLANGCLKKSPWQPRPPPPVCVLVCAHACMLMSIAAPAYMSACAQGNAILKSCTSTMCAAPWAPLQ